MILFLLQIGYYLTVALITLQQNNRKLIKKSSKYYNNTTWPKFFRTKQLRITKATLLRIVRIILRTSERIFVHSLTLLVFRHHASHQFFTTVKLKNSSNNNIVVFLWPKRFVHFYLTRNELRNFFLNKSKRHFEVFQKNFQRSKSPVLKYHSVSFRSKIGHLKSY